MKAEMLKLSRQMIQCSNKFIFLFDFTESPDGDALACGLANGLDPNRDASPIQP